MATELRKKYPSLKNVHENLRVFFVHFIFFDQSWWNIVSLRRTQITSYFGVNNPILLCVLPATRLLMWILEDLFIEYSGKRRNFFVVTLANVLFILLKSTILSTFFSHSILYTRSGLTFQLIVGNFFFLLSFNSSREAWNTGSLFWGERNTCQRHRPNNFRLCRHLFPTFFGRITFSHSVKRYKRRRM